MLACLGPRWGLCTLFKEAQVLICFSSWLSSSWDWNSSFISAGTPGTPWAWCCSSLLASAWFSWASSWPPQSWPSSFQLLHQAGLGSECLQQRFLATFHHKSRHLIVFIFTLFSPLVASSPPSLGTGLSCWSRVEKLLAWALRYMVDSWILVNSTLLSNNLLYSLHPRSSSTSTSGPGPGTSRGLSGTGCSRTSWGHTWRKRQNQN